MADIGSQYKKEPTAKSIAGDPFFDVLMFVGFLMKLALDYQTGLNL